MEVLNLVGFPLLLEVTVVKRMEPAAMEAVAAAAAGLALEAMEVDMAAAAVLVDPIQRAQ